MAHHRRAPDRSRNEGTQPDDFTLQSTAAATPAVTHPSREVEKGKKDAPGQEAQKSIFDHTIAGFPWPFVLVLSLIAAAVLAIVLKVVGAL